jgi:hypothetical protein
MNSEGSNYLKTKVSGQSEDFFKKRNFFKGFSREIYEISKVVQFSLNLAILSI